MQDPNVKSIDLNDPLIVPHPAVPTPPDNTPEANNSQGTPDDAESVCDVAALSEADATSSAETDDSRLSFEGIGYF